MEDEIFKFLLILLIAPLVQLIMLRFTTAKRWSNHALVRNELIVLCLFYQYTFGWKIWILPILAEFFIEWASLRGYIRFDNPSLDTDYIYSDFFESFTPDDETIRYYTEGDYNGLIANTINLDSTNINEVMRIGKEIRTKKRSIKEIDDIMNQTQIKKFEYILNQLGVRENDKVLEVGFGKGDFLKFLRGKGINASGINVSIVQVDHMKSLGFDVHHVDIWDIPNYPELHGKFDAVVLNGCMEYFLKWSDSRDKYQKLFNIIKKLLNPKSSIKKVSITCIHTKRTIPEQPNFYNKWKQFFLSTGNSCASTPFKEDGLTKYALRENFQVISQENRVLDYYLYSNFIAALWEKKPFTIVWKLVKNAIPLLICYPHYLHTIYAYTGFWMFGAPWIWQFTQQKDGYIPTDHLWIELQLKD